MMPCRFREVVQLVTILLQDELICTARRIVTAVHVMSGPVAVRNVVTKKSLLASITNRLKAIIIVNGCLTSDGRPDDSFLGFGDDVHFAVSLRGRASSLMMAASIDVMTETSLFYPVPMLHDNKITWLIRCSVSNLQLRIPL